MDIDIERLKWDAEYWDEVAPDGAEFYGPEIKNWCECWYKKYTDWSSYFGGCWNEFGDSRYLLKAFFRQRMGSLIPRPTKPEPKGWDGRLPPIGFTEKDCELVGVEGFHQGFEVVAHKGVAAIVWGPYEGDPEGQVETLLASHFRPLRTQAEREREELKRLFMDQRWNDTDAAVDSIIAAGWRKGE